MKLPDDYLGALIDDLAPFGLEFAGVTDGPEDESVIRFEAEPESFLRRHPWTQIDTSYGDDWPPDSLELWIRVDDHGDLVEIRFEVFDVLLWAAADASDLAGRLATLDDPEDQATALGQALTELLTPPLRETDGLT
jgi:hypothetical protein